MLSLGNCACSTTSPSLRVFLASPQPARLCLTMPLASSQATMSQNLGPHLGWSCCVAAGARATGSPAGYAPGAAKTSGSSQLPSLSKLATHAGIAGQPKCGPSTGSRAVASTHALQAACSRRCLRCLHCLHAARPARAAADDGGEPAALSQA